MAVIIDRVLPVRSVAGLLRAGADLLEIRIDRIDADFDRIIRYLKRLRSHLRPSLIGTIRETTANRRQRFAMFQRLIPLVDCVDIEIDAPIGPAVVAAAHRARRRVIVSEHDFAQTPGVRELRRIAGDARRQGADIVKIAARARCPADVTRLLRFCEDSPLPMIAVSMGGRGAVSRIAAPLFGSLFTYACIDAPVAPGQMALRSLERVMRMVYRR